MNLTLRLKTTPFPSSFFNQATPQPAYIIILQHVSMSKLKLLKDLLHYNPSWTGNLSNELSHLSLSISICLFLSTLLSAVPILDTIWITSHPCSLSFVRTTVIRHLALLHTSGAGWLSFSRECGWCASERSAGELWGLFWTLFNLAT